MCGLYFTETQEKKTRRQEEVICFSFFLFFFVKECEMICTTGRFGCCELQFSYLSAPNRNPELISIAHFLIYFVYLASNNGNKNLFIEIIL